jgi:hypothetical protein
VLIYARWRGLSNRPARGAFKLRSGSGDCGGQVQGETCRGLVADGRVGPFRVVVGDPGGDQITGVGQVAEQRLVQKLVPHSAVETFDEAVLHRLARCDVVPFDLVLGAPLQDRIRGQFRPGDKYALVISLHVGTPVTIVDSSARDILACKARIKAQNNTLINSIPSLMISSIRPIGEDLSSLVYS